MLTEHVYIQQFDISTGLDAANLYYLGFAQQTWA